MPDPQYEYWRLPDGRNLEVPTGLTEEEKDNIRFHLANQYPESDTYRNWLASKRTMLGGALNFGVDLAKGAGNLVLGASRGMTALADLVPGVDLSDERQALTDFGRDYLAPNPVYRDSFLWSQIPQALGSTAPFFAAGAAGAALTGGARATATFANQLRAASGAMGLGAAAGVDRQTETIRQRRLSGEQISAMNEAWAAGFGGLIGLSEAFPVMGALKKAGSMTKVRDAAITTMAQRAHRQGARTMAEAMTKIPGFTGDTLGSRVMQHAVSGFLREGTQEAGAAMFQNLVEYNLYNPNLRWTDSLANEFLLGGIAGGITSPIVELGLQNARSSDEQFDMVMEALRSANRMREFQNYLDQVGKDINDKASRWQTLDGFFNAQIQEARDPYTGMTVKDVVNSVGGLSAIPVFGDNFRVMLDPEDPTSFVLVDTKTSQILMNGQRFPSELAAQQQADALKVSNARWRTAVEAHMSLIPLGLEADAGANAVMSRIVGTDKDAFIERGIVLENDSEVDRSLEKFEGKYGTRTEFRPWELVDTMSTADFSKMMASLARQRALANQTLADTGILPVGFIPETADDAIEGPDPSNVKEVLKENGTAKPNKDFPDGMGFVSWSKKHVDRALQRLGFDTKVNDPDFEAFARTVTGVGQWELMGDAQKVLLINTLNGMVPTRYRKSPFPAINVRPYDLNLLRNAEVVISEYRRRNPRSKKSMPFKEFSELTGIDLATFQIMRGDIENRTRMYTKLHDDGTVSFEKMGKNLNNEKFTASNFESLSPEGRASFVAELYRTESDEDAVRYMLDVVDSSFGASADPDVRARAEVAKEQIAYLARVASHTNRLRAAAQNAMVDLGLSPSLVEAEDLSATSINQRLADAMSGKLPLDTNHQQDEVGPTALYNTVTGKIVLNTARFEGMSNKDARQAMVPVIVHEFAHKLAMESATDTEIEQLFNGTKQIVAPNSGGKTFYDLAAEKAADYGNNLHRVKMEAIAEMVTAYQQGQIKSPIGAAQGKSMLKRLAEAAGTVAGIASDMDVRRAFTVMDDMVSSEATMPHRQQGFTPTHMTGVMRAPKNIIEGSLSQEQLQVAKAYLDKKRAAWIERLDAIEAEQLEGDAAQLQEEARAIGGKLDYLDKYGVLHNFSYGLFNDIDFGDAKPGFELVFNDADIGYDFLKSMAGVIGDASLLNTSEIRVMAPDGDFGSHAFGVTFDVGGDPSFMTTTVETIQSALDAAAVKDRVLTGAKVEVIGNRLAILDPKSMVVDADGNTTINKRYSDVYGSTFYESVMNALQYASMNTTYESEAGRRLIDFRVPGKSFRVEIKRDKPTSGKWNVSVMYDNTDMLGTAVDNGGAFLQDRYNKVSDAEADVYDVIRAALGEDYDTYGIRGDLNVHGFFMDITRLNREAGDYSGQADGIEDKLAEHERKKARIRREDAGVKESRNLLDRSVYPLFQSLQKARHTTALGQGSPVGYMLPGSSISLVDTELAKAQETLAKDAEVLPDAPLFAYNAEVGLINQAAKRLAAGVDPELQRLASGAVMFTFRTPVVSDVDGTKRNPLVTTYGDKYEKGSTRSVGERILNAMETPGAFKKKIATMLFGVGDSAIASLVDYNVPLHKLSDLADMSRISEGQDPRDVMSSLSAAVEMVLQRVNTVVLNSITNETGQFTWYGGSDAMSGEFNKHDQITSKRSGKKYGSVIDIFSPLMRDGGNSLERALHDYRSLAHARQKLRMAQKFNEWMDVYEKIENMPVDMQERALGYYALVKKPKKGRGMADQIINDLGPIFRDRKIENPTIADGIRILDEHLDGVDGGEPKILDLYRLTPEEMDIILEADSALDALFDRLLEQSVTVGLLRRNSADHIRMREWKYNPDDAVYAVKDSVFEDGTGDKGVVESIVANMSKLYNSGRPRKYDSGSTAVEVKKSPGIGQSAEPLLDLTMKHMLYQFNDVAQQVIKSRVARDYQQIGRYVSYDDLQPAEQNVHSYITYRLDGERKRMALSPDKNDRLMYNALVAIHNQPKYSNVVTKAIAGMSNVARDLITHTPAFAVRQIMRDSSAIYATMAPYGSGFRGFLRTHKEYLKNFRDAMRDPNVMRGLVQSGSMIPSDTSVTQADDVRKRMERLFKDPSYTGQTRSMEKARAVWGKLNDWSRATEYAARKTVYDATMADLMSKADGSKPFNQEAAETQASLNAIRLINYKNRGSAPALNFLSSITPFLGAGIQGTYVFGRAATGSFRPMGQLSAAQARADFIQRGIVMTAMTVAYWLARQEWDKEDYDAMRDRDRDLYYSFGFGPTSIRIPIAFEAGMLFKVVPEAILNQALGETNSAEFRKSLATAAGAFTQRDQFQGLMPWSFRPIWEVSSNSNSYTGRPLVADYMQSSRETADQYTANTSRFARGIARAAEVVGMDNRFVSPIAIEHIMRNYIPGMGAYVVGVVDAALTSAQTGSLQGTQLDVMDPRNMPAFGTLAMKGRGGLEEDLYEISNEAAQIYGSIQFAKEQGDVERAYDLLMRPTITNKLAVREEVQRLTQYLSDWRNRVDAVRNNTLLSSGERREYIKLLEEERDNQLSIVPLLKEIANE